MKAFQREHGLQDDGLAGKDALTAISKATTVQRGSRRDIPSMLDTRHPANGIYEQVFRRVSQLDKDHQCETGPHSQMLWGSLVSAATAAGFNRIDHVVLSDDAGKGYANESIRSPAGVCGFAFRTFLLFTQAPDVAQACCWLSSTSSSDEVRARS